MFKLYDTVRIKEPTELIRADYIGAVVDVLNNGESYTVEFIDSNGKTIVDSLFNEFAEHELVLYRVE